MFVPPAKTPWNHKTMAVILAELAPNPKAAKILHAKIVLECGRNTYTEGLYCWNYNVGNVRCFGDGQMHTRLSGAWEEKNGVKYVPKDQRFRAYISHQEGVVDMIKILSSQKNFAAAWAVLVNRPEPGAYVVAAKAGGYFTGDLAKYSNAVCSLFSEFSR